MHLITIYNTVIVKCVLSLFQNKKFKPRFNLDFIRYDRQIDVKINSNTNALIIQRFH